MFIGHLSYYYVNIKYYNFLSYKYSDNYLLHIQPFLKVKKEVTKVTKMLIKCPNIKYLNLSYNTIKFNEAIIIAKRYNIDLCSYDKIITISY